jgi:hypothetical protein
VFSLDNLPAVLTEIEKDRAKRLEKEFELHFMLRDVAVPSNGDLRLQSDHCLLDPLW